MFEVNDKVVYGIVGVCEVEDIAAPPIKGIIIFYSRYMMIKE